jgi:hypothetical protein
MSASSGAHRFVWNLRMARPRAVHYDYSIAAAFGAASPITPEGMLVAPGEYSVVLNADGKQSRATLKVVADPRVELNADAVRSALAFARQIDQSLDRDFVVFGELGAVKDQIAQIEKGHPAKETSVAIATFNKAVKPLQAGEGDSSENLGGIGEVLSALATDVEGSDRAPTQPQRDVLASSDARLVRASARWEKIKSAELQTLNAALEKSGQPKIAVPSADRIQIKRVPDAKDLP